MKNKDLKIILKENLSILNTGKNEVSIDIEGSCLYLKIFKETEIGFFKVTAPFNLEYDVWLALHVKIIEDIIGPILHKSTIMGGYTPIYAYTTNLMSIDRQQYEATKITTEYVKTEEDVIAVLHQLNDYIEKVAEPFFEKWSDLRVLNDFIETVPQKKIGEYFGQGATFRKALIYKLCNNPKYDEYFNLLYSYYTERYQENPNGDRSYKQWNDAVILLKEALDNVEPIYNV